MVFGVKNFHSSQSIYCVFSDYILFQIGTEEEPFQHKGIITMYGQVRSPELPVYGAKTLAVRHGALELHGTHVRGSVFFLSTCFLCNQHGLHFRKQVVD